MSDDIEIGRTPGGPAAAGPLGAWGVSGLDYRALTSPVDRPAVRDYRRQSRQRHAAWAEGRAVRVLAIVLIVIVGFVVCAIAAATVSVIADFWSSGSRQGAVEGNSGFEWWMMVAALLVVAVLVAVWAVRSGPRGKWANWYRLDRFAQANRLVAEPLSPSLDYPGAIFGRGSARAGFDRIHSNGGRTLDLGNYRYTTGSGDERTTHSWGYLALQLDRRLPHMLLDSRSNHGLFGTTNLPISVARNQQLRLEGDFNSYFTLYCPHAYEPDALYVFTPDLMALLIDNAGGFDVEIIDDWMFIYRRTPFTMTDPATLQRMFTIAGTVGTKTLSRTERYRDERLTAAGAHGTDNAPPGADEVAPAGRRLKHKNGWVGVAAFVALALAGLWFVIGQR
ncbi:hypothetical protein AB4Y63_11240 [Leifsonia sp. YAF41]|uniref:hypothetical protein n=1 Tax=Leifsonia sp. YAF41 TaxID=3233086 RepID=UPI003F9785DA